MSFEETPYQCPACGAPLPVKLRFVRLVTCDFCQSVSILKDDGLDPTGQRAKLSALPTMFYVDALGALAGREFRVLGRLRYDNGESYWDEWFLGFDDGEPGWLVEDEGTFTYYEKTTVVEDIPAYENFRVGSEMTVQGLTVRIQERGTATIVGGEGQLGFPLLPGEPINYVDGQDSEGRKISIEFAPEETEFSIGRSLPREQVQVHQDEFF